MLNIANTEMDTTLATRVTDALALRVDGAMKKTGLDKSDLLRVGIIRVVEEIEKTGSLRIGNRKRQPQGAGK